MTTQQNLIEEILDTTLTPIIKYRIDFEVDSNLNLEPTSPPLPQEWPVMISPPEVIEAFERGDLSFYTAPYGAQKIDLYATYELRIGPQTLGELFSGLPAGKELNVNIRKLEDKTMIVSWKEEIKITKQPQIAPKAVDYAAAPLNNLPYERLQELYTQKDASSLFTEKAKMQLVQALLEPRSNQDTTRQERLNHFLTERRPDFLIAIILNLTDEEADPFLKEFAYGLTLNEKRHLAQNLPTSENDIAADNLKDKPVIAQLLIKTLTSGDDSSAVCSILAENLSRYSLQTRAVALQLIGKHGDENAVIKGLDQIRHFSEDRRGDLFLMLYRDLEKSSPQYRGAIAAQLKHLESRFHTQGILLMRPTSEDPEEQIDLTLADDLRYYNITVRTPIALRLASSGHEKAKIALIHKLDILDLAYDAQKCSPYELPTHLPPKTKIYLSLLANGSDEVREELRIYNLRYEIVKNLYADCSCAISGDPSTADTQDPTLKETRDRARIEDCKLIAAALSYLHPDLQHYLGMELFVTGLPEAQKHLAQHLPDYAPAAQRMILDFVRTLQNSPESFSPEIKEIYATLVKNTFGPGLGLGTLSP